MRHSQRARQMRLKAGLTGEDAARLLKTDKAVIYRMERGVRPLKEHWARRMAELYGCRPSDIDPLLVDPDEYLLLDTYRKLSDKVKPEAHRLLADLRDTTGPGTETVDDDIHRLFLEMTRNFLDLQERTRAVLMRRRPVPGPADTE